MLSAFYKLVDFVPFLINGGVVTQAFQIALPTWKTTFLIKLQAFTPYQSPVARAMNAYTAKP